MNNKEELNQSENNVKKTKQKKEKQYRDILVPLMNEAYKEFADAPKSQGFSKDINVTESEINVLLKKMDVLKKIQECNSEETESNPISKLSKIIDKIILQNFKNTPDDEDFNLVYNTLKKKYKH